VLSSVLSGATVSAEIRLYTPMGRPADTDATGRAEDT
jgi:hypothetical protein